MSESSRVRPVVGLLLVLTVGLAPLAVSPYAGATGAADRCARTVVQAEEPPQDPAVVVVRPSDGGFDPARVVFRATGQPDDAVRVAPRILELPGQGTWTIDADTGSAAFSADDAGADEVLTPEQGYAGDQADDAPALRVLDASCGAVALPDRGTTAQGVTARVQPLANDTPGRFDRGGKARFRTAPRFDADALPAGAVLTEGDTAADDVVEVEDQGTWSWDGRTARFTPEASFTGRTKAVGYVVRDSAGHRASALMRVDVREVTPRAVADRVRVEPDGTATLDVLANDVPGARSVPLRPGTLRLRDGDDLVEELVVAGEGAWAVDDGELTFEPADGFTGQSSAVTYRVADANGTVTRATARVLVAEVPTGPGPRGVDDTRRTPSGTPVRVDVLDNDKRGSERPRFEPDSLRIVAPGGRWRLRLPVADEGVWTVDDGRLRFAPRRDFSGETTAVGYRAVDILDRPVTAEVVVRVERPGEAPELDRETTPGVAVTVDVPEEATAAPRRELRAGSVCVVPASVDVDGDRLKAAGEPDRCVKEHRRNDVGVWDVDTEGVLTFTPATGFTGDASVVYRVADSGDARYRGRLSVEVATSATGTTTTPGSPLSSTPSSTPSYGSTYPGSPSYGSSAAGGTTYGDTLPDTGGPTFLALLAGLALVGAGGAVVARSRRRG